MGRWRCMFRVNTEIFDLNILLLMFEIFIEHGSADDARSTEDALESRSVHI